MNYDKFYNKFYTSSTSSTRYQTFTIAGAAIMRTTLRQDGHSHRQSAHAKENCCAHSFDLLASAAQFAARLVGKAGGAKKQSIQASSESFEATWRYVRPSNAVATHVQGCIERRLAAHESPNNADVRELGVTAPMCCSNPRVDEQWLLGLRSLNTSSFLFEVSNGLMENYSYNEVRGNAENSNERAE